MSRVVFVCSDCCKEHHSLSGLSKILLDILKAGESKIKVLTHVFVGESSFWHAYSHLTVCLLNFSTVHVF